MLGTFHIRILLGHFFNMSITSRFNSGKFAVPWEDTEAVLNELSVEMTIYTM